jgi:hypothetical protein
VTLGKVRGFLALRKSLGCLFDPSPLDMSIVDFVKTLILGIVAQNNPYLFNFNYQF